MAVKLTLLMKTAMKRVLPKTQDLLEAYGKEPFKK
jgi:hypothetical protein